MPRRRRQNHDTTYQLPAMPFLSIMLGMIAIMVVATLGLNARKQHQQEGLSVKLSGVPSHFIPVQMRASDDYISWFENGRWEKLYVPDPDYASGELLQEFLKDLFNKAKNQRTYAQFLDFLKNSSADNRQLSYRGKQKTLIIWVEPDGVFQSEFIQRIILNHQLPLRVGLLPIQPGEKVEL